MLFLLTMLCGGTGVPNSQTVRRMGTNVILITMDTLRADHLGCYGDTQIQTPTLDAPADGIRCFRTCSKPYASQ